jgi:CheY-like chemotaxis protein
MPRGDMDRCVARGIARRESWGGCGFGHLRWSLGETGANRDANLKPVGDLPHLHGFVFANQVKGNILGICMYPADSQPAVAKDSILVVDDEQPILEAFTAALSPHFEVTSASSAREADFALRKKPYRVVVSDHLMPGGNGMSFLVRAREEYPQMQRILVTGYMKPEMLMRSVNEAALFRYLLKPVTLAELIKVVKEAAAVGAEKS